MPFPIHPPMPAAGAPDIGALDATSFSNVGTCPTAGSYVEASSRATSITNFNSSLHRLEAWIRYGSASCSSSYVQVDGDVSVASGVSQTVGFNLSNAVLASDANTPGSDGSLYAQYEWRIYRRSDSALLDSRADSCRSCTFTYCL